MDVQGSITFRLESYLLQLAGTNQRWTQWLSSSEQAVLAHDIQGLVTFSESSEDLMKDIKEILDNRTKLLADASDAGLPAVDLMSLARSLPAWKRPTLRQSMRRAQQQLSSLQRLHAAAWVLINDSLQFCRGTMMLMTLGQQAHDVYTAIVATDREGGQLLDANL